MKSKQLENEFYQLLGRSSFAPASQKEIEDRFCSLRLHGRLPRGRQFRNASLTDEHVANAVLSLCTRRSGWAGHAVACLCSLKPIGSQSTHFAANLALLETIELFLKNDTGTRKVIRLSIAEAEDGPNSKGFATLTWEKDGERTTCGFMSPNALTMFTEGAEDSYDPETREAPISIEYSFSGLFFQKLAKRIHDYRAFPTVPTGDGNEYSAAEQEEARRKRLGCTQHSNFLHVGVDNQVTWPREEMRIEFEGYWLVLLPKTKDNVQSVHVDMAENRISNTDAITLINRFLSLLVWCDDQYAITQGGGAGSSAPVPVGKRDMGFTTAFDWIFDRKIPSNPKLQKALAIYREGRNAEAVGLVGYAVLSYYKILELCLKSSNARRSWIAEKLQAPDESQILGYSTFLQDVESQKPEEYIWKACRCAVAHAKENNSSDLDDETEVSRLATSVEVMRYLARILIKDEFGFSDDVCEPN